MVSLSPHQTGELQHAYRTDTPLTYIKSGRWPLPNAVGELVKAVKPLRGLKNVVYTTNLEGPLEDEMMKAFRAKMKPPPRKNWIE